MSSLPTLNLQDRQIRLPSHTEILNPETPFCSKQHHFRPAKQIHATIADYASSLVSTIEALFQSKYKNPIAESEVKYRSYYRSWNPRFENGAKLGWKVVQAKEGDSTELRYLVSAEKPDGSKERFTVFKNPHEAGFRRAVWDINGFFPGKLVYDSDQDRLRLINPGVNDLGKLNSNYLSKSPEKSRVNKVHRELVNHAQWLVDVVASPQYQINGGGKIIGRNKIYANKNRFGGKTIFLLNQAATGIAQASKTFSVETNAKNEIIEIRQFSSKAKYFIRIEKTSDESIVKQAKVKIYYDDKKQNIIDKLMKLRAVEDLFKNTPGVIDINKIITEENELLAKLNGGAYADVFEIKNSDDEAVKLQIKNALTSANNIRSIGSSTGLIGRPFGDEGQVPELLKQFYDYASLQPGQFSFLFHDGGTNDAYMSYEGKTIPLRLLGPSSLRSPYSRSGKGQHILIDSKLEAFFKSIGVDVTTLEQNKAILRWTLVHNEQALNGLGLYLERKDGKEIIHVINDASLETKIKNSKLIIPNAVSESKEITLTNLMNLNIFDEVKFGKGSQRPDHTKFSNINANKFYDVLKYIGFHVADPIETEEYFHTVINEEKVQKFINDVTKTGLNSYKAHLNLSLAQRFLAQDGYTDFQRVKTSAIGGEILECSKGGKQYLVRSTALAYANHKQFTDLKDRATKARKIPLMIRLKNVDIMKRSATSYNFQNIAP